MKSDETNGDAAPTNETALEGCAAAEAATERKKIEASQKPLLPEAISLAVSTEPFVIKIADQQEESQISAEVEEIIPDRDRIQQTLQQLLPEGIRNSDLFFERLRRLQCRIGRNPASNKLAAALILVTLGSLTPEEGEAFLRKLPKLKSPYFFQVQDALPLILADADISPQFAAEWFVDLMRRIGNDASGGFWNGLGTFCEKRSATALEVQRCLRAPATEEQIRVAAYLLGALRGLKLQGKESTVLASIEEEFRSGSDDNVRSTYDRSWMETCRRGAMTKAHFDSLVSRMASGTAHQREQVFSIVARCLTEPAIDPECFQAGMCWLNANVSGATPPAAKYQIIDSVDRLQQQHRRAGATLLLKLQPILSEHTGLWQRLEFILVAHMQYDLSSFKEFCVDLAEQNAGNWLKVLRQPQNYDYFFSELRKYDVGDMVAKMVFSSDWKCRKLGLFFFDKLDITGLPTIALESASDKQIQIAVYELQREIIHGQALARYLIMLIPFAEKINTEFKNEFYSEIKLQLRNYPGSFRQECEKRKTEYPLLKKCLDDVKAYFDAFHQVQESGLHAMEVAGYQKAIRMHARRFQNEVSRGAEERSVLMQLFKKVSLLYGKSWRTYHGGKLGQTSGLQQFSSSIEVPRLEIIAPEEMALRRLHASLAVQQLSGIVEEDEQ